MSRLALLAPLFLSLAACTSTYVQLDFSPSPAQSVLSSEDGEPQARVLVSVLAAERPDRDPEQPFELRLRLRVESLADLQVQLDPEQILLVGADLRAFATPRLELHEGSAAAGPYTVEPGAARGFDLFFPLGGLEPRDLEGLNLRLGVRLGERDVLLGFGFERRLRLEVINSYRYDPFFYGYPYGYPYGYYGHFGLHRGIHR